VKFERVRVGDVLALQRRSVTVSLDTEYEEIGIRSFGRGIFHKEPISGLDLGSKRVFRIEPRDLVISNVFAWEGAIGVASDAEMGKIGSHRFMTFIPKDDRIDTAWASWFFLSEGGLELIRRASPGSAGRNRTLAIERFEALEIPLPPIAEQRRVSALIGAVAHSSRQFSVLEQRSTVLSEATCVSLAARPDLDDRAKTRAGWERTKLGSVVVPAEQKVKVEPSRAYPNVGILSYGRGLFTKPDIDGSQTSASVLNRVCAGQFIYSRLFAFEGAYAYVPAELDGRYVSNEFPAFDPVPDRLDARWLATYLRSPGRWAELGGSSKGLGVRRQRVPEEAVLAYEVWLPPIEQQRKLVATIHRVDSVRAAGREIEARVAALVPAALNAAFADLT
jgi:type I restriction enzyme, S subunit